MPSVNTPLQKALQAYVVAGITALIALNVWYVRQINDHEKRLSLAEKSLVGLESGKIMRADLDILRLQIFQQMGDKVDARLDSMMNSIRDMHGQAQGRTNYYNTTGGVRNHGDGYNWNK